MQPDRQPDSKSDYDQERKGDREFPSRNPQCCDDARSLKYRLDLRKNLRGRAEKHFVDEEARGDLPYSKQQEDNPEPCQAGPCQKPALDAALERRPSWRHGLRLW